MLDRILDFPRQNVEHAMRPRAHVDVVRDTRVLDLEVRGGRVAGVEGLDPDTEGAQVGDGAVGGSAQVGVGDEPRAQGVRGVGEWVDPGAADRVLDEGVDRFRVQGPTSRLVPFGHSLENRPGGDAAGSRQTLSAAAGHR